MNWTSKYFSPWAMGLILFFVVPFVIWLIVVLIARIKNKAFKFVGLIVGGDNRLSLSKLQALAWTLVIFGSYFAAMGIHEPIDPNVQGEADAAKKQVELADSRVKSLATDLQLAKTKLDTATKEKIDADKALSEARKAVDAATPDKKDAAQADAAQKEKTLAEKTLNFDNANTNFQKAQTDAGEAEKSLQTAKENAERLAQAAFSEKWVDIPMGLLALAGIAIGSGVFSSLISAVTGEKQAAEITNVEAISATDFNNPNNFPNSFVSNSPNLLLITGNNFGTKKGRVRFGIDYGISESVPVLFWDNSRIVVDVTSNSRDVVIVDTPNGKLTYRLMNVFSAEGVTKQDVKAKQTVLAAAETALKQTFEKPGATDAEKAAALKAVDDLKQELRKFDKQDVIHLRLGEETSSYEFADLFRDDKNPAILDLMKFQMFGWTVIAIFIYAWLFLQNLNADVKTLPLVPDTIVLLTGLSQAGYLGGKGVSNIPKNENNP